MGSKFVKYLSTAMAIFYMAFGFFIGFTHLLIDRIPNNRLLIGSIFMAYGLFRIVKITIDIQKLRRQNKGFFDPHDEQ